MQLYIPQSGDAFSLCIKKGGLKSISFGRMFRWSSYSGLWIRRPVIQRKMTALKRFFQLAKLDQVPGVHCKKCINYPIDFHTSIVKGNELQYSGYERTIIDKILRRNNVNKD